MNKQFFLYISVNKHLNSSDSVGASTLFPPKNRPGAKSAVSSVTSSSLPVWDGRFKNQELVEQEARFDAGEESRCKADPEQVAIVMRNARTKDNTRRTFQGYLF